MLKQIGFASIAGSTVLSSYLLYRHLNANKTNSDSEKKQVLLVGYGYAGRTFYGNLDKSKYDIKVILGGKPTALQPHFLDSLENGSRSKIVHSIDESNKDFKIYDQIVSIDPNEKIVNTSVDETEYQYKYDYLVMAIGHETSTFGIPGVDSYCKFFTSYDDLEKLRQISNTKKLKIAVVGASLAGLEIAGYLSDNHEIDVIEYATSILPTMKKSTQEAVYDLMQSKHKINFKLGSRLLKVGLKDETKRIVYTEVGGLMKEENEYDIVIWTAGVKPNCNMDRWLHTNKVNENLQLIGEPSIYAIGDCNNTMPKSGQSAKRQGEYLAKVFNSNFEHKESFVFKSMGIVIKLPNCVYIENEYYSGFAPRFVHEIIHYLNI